jgi:predicted transcriptional regulator
MIPVYVDDETLRRLKFIANYMEREIADLAECAISEAALKETRHLDFSKPNTIKKRRKTV